MKEKKEKERKSRNFVVLRARLSLFYHYFSLSSFLFFSMPRETKRNLHDLIVFDQKNATISLRSLLERILLFRMIRKNKNSHHFLHTRMYVYLKETRDHRLFIVKSSSLGSSKPIEYESRTCLRYSFIILFSLIDRNNDDAPPRPTIGSFRTINLVFQTMMIDQRRILNIRFCVNELSYND